MPSASPPPITRQEALVPSLVARINAKLSARWRAWIDSRHDHGLSTRLVQKNIYILPTRAGLLYAVLLIALLIGSINYQLNLGYLLTFMLAGVGVMSMHVTHGNLRGVTLAVQEPEPAFAGQQAKLRLTLTAPDKHRYGISVQCGASGHVSLVDIEPGVPTQHDIAVAAPKRGLHDLDRLTIQTRFPLGIWRAWTYWRPALQLLVYPAPEHPAPPLPELVAVPAGNRDAAHRQGTSGEFDGVRAYRAGDALKRVVWKKFAKADELVSRDDVALVKSMLVLDLADTPAASLELQLSRLTSWVLTCDKHDLPFELRLHSTVLPCGSGHTHKHAALKLLALY
jgi:uncharacterized protein (DUF58 family)